MTGLETTLYIHPTALSQFIRFFILALPSCVALFFVLYLKKSVRWALVFALLFTTFFIAVDPMREISESPVFYEDVGGVPRSEFASYTKQLDTPVQVFERNTRLRPVQIQKYVHVQSLEPGSFALVANGLYIRKLDGSFPALTEDNHLTVRYPKGIHIADLLQIFAFFLPIVTVFVFLYLHPPPKDKSKLLNTFYALCMGMWMLSICLIGINVLVDYFNIPSHKRIYSTEYAASEGRLYNPSQFNKESNESDMDYMARVASTLNRHVTHFIKENSPYVSFTENWLLWARGNTFRYYDHIPILKRGYGECGSFSLATCDVLQKNGYACNPIGLDGHVVAQAFTRNGEEIIVDGDYGIIIPHSLVRLGQEPDLILKYYSEIVSKKHLLHLRSIYAKDSRTAYRPMELGVMWSVMKWLIPLAVFFTGAGVLFHLYIFSFVKRVGITIKHPLSSVLFRKETIAILSAICIGSGAVLWLSPSKTIVLDSISHNTGYGWLAPAPSPGRMLQYFYKYSGNNASDPKASRAVLYEDGAPLGPAHVAHTEIRAVGQGRYSHWGETLYFSASDNSSPLTNGKSYTVDIILEPRAWVYVIGLSALIFLLGGIFLRLRRYRNGT